MVNEQLYNKTVDILVQAYFNDTLIIHSCGCAVGNLVAANNDLKVVKIGKDACWINNNGKQIEPAWDKVFGSIMHTFPFHYSHQEVDASKYNGNAKEQIDSCGYNPEELREIERAFSKGYNKAFSKDRYFTGLMSVVNTLDEIHKNKDERVSHLTKAKFKKVNQ